MTVDEAIEQARWYEREDIATTLRESANVLADECERLRERVRVLEEALEPLARASLSSSVGPVYVIGSRMGAPYDRNAAEAAVQRARAALAKGGE